VWKIDIINDIGILFIDDGIIGDDDDEIDTLILIRY
jgi:hypothetical protein